MWDKQFSCAHIKPLIICRGPVRKEAIDSFAALGISKCGMLLSDKDSLSQERVRAPELRNPSIALCTHSVSDYSGATAEERSKRIQEIIAICKTHNYDSVFAGYGFMAEDIRLVSALEVAGINFIGPNSKVVYAAGFKDEAKRIASGVNISVTPGVDHLTALALLRRYPDSKSLATLVRTNKLSIENQYWDSDQLLPDVAEAVLAAGRESGKELLSIEDLCAEAIKQVETLFSKDPCSRLRLKAIGGGGGKGQRVLAAPVSYSGDSTAQLQAALEPVEAAVRDVLSEAKATGVRDNRNILIERNIENTRHQEIQMIGNGDWVLTMGGRDCSLQMHEQKLLELSVTNESLTAAIEHAHSSGNTKQVKALELERDILCSMEAEAERFAVAVGLNSLSTFECIVADNTHYFMEVNTRIQVEHRVSELCYGLRFYNPTDMQDYFEVHSLIELMVLLAVHGKALPKPERIVRAMAAVEARLNATNDALFPHAGGMIKYWSPPLAGEIRDDQGIGDLNPDTGSFIPYHLTGSYDSNIALLLNTGDNRAESLEHLAESLRCMVLRGENLATNLAFHRGLVHWLLGKNPEARPSTAFVVCYLAQVTRLSELAANVDINYLWAGICARAQKNIDTDITDLLVRKSTLLKRPLNMLLASPHLLCGWLSHNATRYTQNAERYGINGNSWSVLTGLYHYLGLTDRPDLLSKSVWHNDACILQEGNEFYQMLAQKLAIDEEVVLLKTLSNSAAPKGIGTKLWKEIGAAHQGFQCANEILSIPAILAADSNFDDLSIDEHLNEHIPKGLRDPKRQAQSKAILAPPPSDSRNEIVAPSGGMFYRRELPELPPLITAGQEFKAGDPLCVIEVMKMFNKVYAKFDGVIEDVLVEKDEMVIKQGQPLFRVRPAEEYIVPDKTNIEKARKIYSDDILKRIDFMRATK